MRKRLSYANVTATLALVFAMSGGAMAANHYLITSTKQINPKVLKKLTGKPGTNGTAGATGPTGPAGSPGAAGAKGEAGSPGKNGEPGKEGKQGEEGQRGPSDTYEVELSASTSETAADATQTLTLSNLPAGAYAIYGKASIAPVETNTSSSECTLVAGTDSDKSFVPLSKEDTYIVAINTELTHTFASTGTVTMSCLAFADKWILDSESSSFGGTRIVATRVDTQHKTTEAAT
jgi:hypothetical protein